MKLRIGNLGRLYLFNGWRYGWKYLRPLPLGPRWYYRAIQPDEYMGGWGIMFLRLSVEWRKAGQF